MMLTQGWVLMGWEEQKLKGYANLSRSKCFQVLINCTKIQNLNLTTHLDQMIITVWVPLTVGSKPTTDWHGLLLNCWAPQVKSRLLLMFQWEDHNMNIIVIAG